MSSPISNWVILTPGVEKRLRFSDHRIVQKGILDPVTSVGKMVQAGSTVISLEDPLRISLRASLISVEGFASFSRTLTQLGPEAI